MVKRELTSGYGHRIQSDIEQPREGVVVRDLGAGNRQDLHVRSVWCDSRRKEALDALTPRNAETANTLRFRNRPRSAGICLPVPARVLV
jgi:hypothetical protein